MKISRLIAGLLGSALLFGASVSNAQTIRLLVGYPPGGAVDALARMFAVPLAKATGQTVIVENRAGASGQIAAQALKAAAPDGNTIMLAPDAVIVTAPHTYPKLAYSPLTDFQAVAHAGTFEYGIAVGSGSPAKTFKEWADLARANPNNGAYGTTGLGTGPHFVGLMLEKAIGVPLTAVPYKGVGPATIDLVGGQIPAAILPFGQLEPQIKGGKLRVLAQTSDKRQAWRPDVPTLKELGFPSLESIGWYGIFAPAGTNPALVHRYNAVINQALETREVRETMAGLGLGIKEMRPDEMSAMVRADYDRWRDIVRTTGYTAEEK